MSSISRALSVPKYVYLHYPFCKRKCYYCDFAVHAVGKSEDNLDLLNDYSERYVSNLLKEIDLTMSQISPDKQTNHDMKTLYIGGGTPSLIPIKHLERILNKLREYYTFSPVEYTMECDPGTFDLEKINIFSDLGVNRLSLGIQSIHDKTLTAIGRSHNADDVWKSIDIISKSKKFSDFSNVSFDLIIGLPHEGLPEFMKSLEELVKIKPGHISIYFLTLEKNTVFTQKYHFHEGSKPLPSLDETCEIFRQTHYKLKDYGYNHYEISSYSLGDKTRGIHNSNYWEGDSPFFGFGMGAASFFNEVRFTRPRTLTQYYKWVGALEEQGIEKAIYSQGEKEPIGSLEWIKSVLMGKTRTSDGFDLKLIQDQRLVDKMKEFCQPYIFSELIDSASLERNILKYTRPSGFLYSDEITSRLFLHLEEESKSF